jgi:hypothetical protein
MSITTFLRRTAATLGAIAAMTVTGAAAQTMTLSGTTANTCTFSTMSVAPNGNITVQCGGGSASPGTFTLSAPTTLTAGDTTSASTIRVLRSNGSAGPANVNFTVTGAGCTSAATGVSFVDGDAVAKPIIVTASTTPETTCTVALTFTDAGQIGSPATKTMTVKDPNADVLFAMANPATSADVGGSARQIIVTREGGSANAWTVPFSLSGALTASGQMIAGAGSVSPSTHVLSFPANSTQATITYTPPSTAPAAVTLPASLTVLLGTPVAVIPGTQQGTKDTANDTTALTLNGPAVGCPVAQTDVVNLEGAGKLTTTKLPSGGIGTFMMPTPETVRGVVMSSLKFTLSETTSSYPVAPWNYEIHVNKCRGLVQPSTTDKCYAVSGNRSIFEKVIFTKTTASGTYSTPAGITGAGYCYAPASGGPYYINIRYNYLRCNIAGNCGWMAQWKTYAY